MRPRRAGRVAATAFAAGVVTSAAVACGDGGVVAPPPSPVDASVDAESNDAVRVRRDSGAVFCEPEDASAPTIPADYAALTNPTGAGAAAAGRATFQVRCATCHGSQGKGNGPERPAKPPPANLTTLRRSDAWLFWRISEGGVDLPFCSAMPAFKSYLDEATRWELVSFVQSLGAPADGGADASGAGP